LLSSGQIGEAANADRPAQLRIEEPPTLFESTGIVEIVQSKNRLTCLAGIRNSDRTPKPTL
jgi:hypothetical protein